MLRVFSLIRVVILVPLMIISTLITLFLMLIFFPNKSRIMISKQYFRLILLMINIRYSMTRKLKVKGKILAGVHVSYVDIVVFEALVDASFTAKAEVKSWPLWGWGASMLRTIFVERVGRSAIDNYLIAAKKALKKDANIVVYPEGTTSDNPLKAFRIGAFRLSKESGNAIVPMVLKYSDVKKVAWVGDMSFFPHVVSMLGSFKSVKAKLTVLDELLPENFEDDKQMRDFAREAMQIVYDDESLQRSDVTYNDIFKTDNLSQQEIVTNYFENKVEQSS